MARRLIVYLPNLYSSQQVFLLMVFLGSDVYSFEDCFVQWPSALCAPHEAVAS